MRQTSRHGPSKLVMEAVRKRAHELAQAHAYKALRTELEEIAVHFSEMPDATADRIALRVQNARILVRVSVSLDDG